MNIFDLELYLYYQKIQKDEQLPKYYKKAINDEDEIMFLDANLKLQSQEYYSIGTISASNDNSMIAFAEDNNGRREFTIKILNAELITGKKTLWMHAASLGEYEQGVPILKALTEHYPDHQWVISFFSPSGYEIKKNRINIIFKFKY